MNQEQFKETSESLSALGEHCNLDAAEVYIFGVFNAAQDLCGLLWEKRIVPKAILDNNPAKQGTCCQGVQVISPQDMMAAHTAQDQSHEKIVLIVSRAYEAMARQLREMGFSGRIEKLVEYHLFHERSAEKVH